jgi:hypothetical protein
MALILSFHDIHSFILSRIFPAFQDFLYRILSLGDRQLQETAGLWASALKTRATFKLQTHNFMALAEGASATRRGGAEKRHHGRPQGRGQVHGAGVSSHSYLGLVEHCRQFRQRSAPGQVKG